MGDVIRKGAAVDDIVHDIFKTLTNAAAKGDTWKSLAEERLSLTGTILRKVNTDIVDLKKTLLPLEATVDVEDRKADRFLGEKSDQIWNKLDRPGNDPALALLLPGGISYYTDGSDEEQPDRMDLFAELLESGIHPRLDPIFAKGIADEVRAEAAVYRTCIDAVRGPRAKLKLLDKVKTAVARSGQMDLANLKRRYRSEGFSEAEIHKVIPDRSPPKAKRNPEDT